MTKLWCKLWNFVLNIFTSIVEGVGMLLETVGTVLVDVLGGVADAVGKALGISGSTVLWLGLGVAAAWLLFGGDSEDDAKPGSNSLTLRTEGGDTSNGLN